MAASAPSAANTVDRFSGKFYKEYVRKLRLKELMGTDPSKPIQVIEDLKKGAGDQITVPLVRRLQNDAIIDDDDIEGQEEAMVDYGHQITVNARGNGVQWGKMAQKKTKIDYLEASQSVLEDWVVSDRRDLMIKRLYSMNVNGKAFYDANTAAQQDAFLDANVDRILYGAGVSNLSTSSPAGGATYDHSGSLGALNNTDDKLTAAAVSLMKRRCKSSVSGTTAQRIRPVMTKDGEWYILLCGSLLFRDVKANLQTLLSNGFTRGPSNPIWKDGDIIYDGVIIKEIPEIGDWDTEYIPTAGSGSIKLGACFMLGAQALGYAVAQRPMMAVETFGYKKLKRKVGVAMDEIIGIEKLMFNDVMHGVHMGFFAGVADT